MLPSWEYAIDQHLNWGKLRVTYNDPQNYWETLLHAWPRLTMMWAIILYFSVGSGIFLGCRWYSKKRNHQDIWVDWEGLGIGFLLAILMIPLFAMLLIEPYHLSFLQIPATYFWA